VFTLAELVSIVTLAIGSPQKSSATGYLSKSAAISLASAGSAGRLFVLDSIPSTSRSSRC